MFCYYNIWRICHFVRFGLNNGFDETQQNMVSADILL